MHCGLNVFVYVVCMILWHSSGFFNRLSLHLSEFYTKNSTCCSSNLEPKVMLNVQLESDNMLSWLCMLFLMWCTRDDAITLWVVYVVHHLIGSCITQPRYCIILMHTLKVCFTYLILGTTPCVEMVYMGLWVLYQQNKKLSGWLHTHS